MVWVGGVSRVGAVEEGEDFIAWPGQGAAEPGDLDEAGGDLCADRGSQSGYDVLAFGPACGAVGMRSCAGRRLGWLLARCGARQRTACRDGVAAFRSIRSAPVCRCRRLW